MLLYMYTIILILNLYYAAKINLAGMLTRQESQEWLKNMSGKPKSDNPYCRLCCLDVSSQDVTKTCGFHTMCAYQSNKTGPACKGYIRMKFSAADKAAIVDAHNTLRNRVAGGKELMGSPGPQFSAANMRAVEWNNELEKIAERWAAQCIFAHDYCRDSVRYPVGQNIARGNLSESNEILFIRDWYSSVNSCPSTAIPSYQSRYMKSLGLTSYTQIIWADTYQIGCARGIFQTVGSDNMVIYVEQFFCNYGPAGNIPDQPVYHIGAPGTRCPEGTQLMLKYENLCGTEDLTREKAATKRNVTFSRGIFVKNVYLTFLVTIVVLMIL